MKRKCFSGIGRSTTQTLARLVIRVRITIRFDRTPIKVPGRMSEQRHHHREPDEERDRAARALRAVESPNIRRRKHAYRVGQLVGRLVRPSPKRFLVLIVSAVLCVYFAFAYPSVIQMGSANTSDVVNLGALLGLCFLSLGFLLPFTRVLVPNKIEILWSKAIEYFAGLFRG